METRRRGGTACDGSFIQHDALPRRPGACVRRQLASSRCSPPCPLRGTRPAAGPRAWPAPPGGPGTGPHGRAARGGCQARPGTEPGGLDGAGRVEAGYLRSRAAGQPASPTGIGAGCHCPRQRRGRARGHRPGPPRARPCRPSPPAGPGVSRTAPPRSPPAGPFFSSPFPPGSAALARGLPSGPDLTRRAERSVRRDGPADGPPPETPTAPGRPTATPDEAPGTAGDPLLTIEQVTAELRVSRAAFYRWRRQGAGPPAVRLPGGGVRVRRSALSTWLRRLEEDTAAEEQGADGQL
jgi:excisionase family DNA binding protein